jgi:hypothetical protein
MEMTMQPLTRRMFLAGAAAIGALGQVLSRSAAEETTATAETTIRQAFAFRRSTRVYGDGTISQPVLIDLLQTANGINRPESGGRTAPSWRGAMDVDIYVATADGTFLFDPSSGALTPKGTSDIRASTSPQPFVAAAPVVLIYVSDRKRLIEAAGEASSEGPDQAAQEQHRVTAFVDSAIIAQNVYLYCAAMGLGTCLIGGNDPQQIGAALSLAANQVVTYVQPVGQLP